MRYLSKDWLALSSASMTKSKSCCARSYAHASQNVKKKVFRKFFWTLKDWNNFVIVRKQWNYIETLPVNKATSVRSIFSLICETCGQVIHDEARAISNQKYNKKVNLNLVNNFYGYSKLKASFNMTSDYIVKYLG